MPGTVVVNGSGKQFLARTGFTVKHDRRRGVGCHAGRVQRILKRRVLADDGIKGDFILMYPVLGFRRVHDGQGFGEHMKISDKQMHPTS